MVPANFGRIVLAFCSLLVLSGGCRTAPAPDLAPLPTALPEPAERVSFAAAREVFEARCAVCHGCYDAPCQVVLTSPEGIARGASKEVVYDGSRLLAVPPTRLFEDAKTTAGWREKGFWSVLGAHEGGASGGSASGLMASMLELGAAHRFPAGEPLPDSVPLSLERELSCPQPAEFAEYVADHPQWGMPYGTAPLSSEELATLGGWLAQGAVMPQAQASLPPQAVAAVARWEAFLNARTLRERIVARYLYEHWFLAHLYFDDLSLQDDDGPFFRVVRSRTPPGQPIDEIATRRPYDDPGSDEFWYRLRPITSTILHKTHTLYALSDARMARLRELFLEPSWEAASYPGWAPEQASNPFVSFAAIPARARYQFFLDDAQYFVMTFIRGPVCRGQIATNVIEDHFFVAFLDPDHDLSVTDPAWLEAAKEDLNLPAEHLSHLVPGEFFVQYGMENRRYLERREKLYAAAFPHGMGMEGIWDGDGDNRNALLTVFRHENNATVLQGWQGGWPETAWVLDYPIFERIYYDLVAGFDVFGNVAHQAATRLYMDHLRMQGEDNFLGFLPADRRKAIHASWYVGATDSIDYRWVDTLRDTARPTRIAFSGDDVKVELLEKILAARVDVAGAPDLLNRCSGGDCVPAGSSSLERAAEAELRRIAAIEGPWVSLLPDVTRLRVRSGGDAAAWTLVLNRAHTNVAYMFDEEARLEPARDTLTILRGYVGSYPNFAFDVPLEELGEFRAGLEALRSSEDLSALAARYGVRRTDTDFWPVMDWFVADFRVRKPVEAGLFDLGRYENH